jgi:putative transposase
VKGRKRHLLVDTAGLILHVVVGSAGEQDWEGGMAVARAAAHRLPGLRLVWADRVYRGLFVRWAAETCRWRVVIVERPAQQRGFVPQPHRWVVERSFAWLGRSRRLSKDYEALTHTAEAWIYLASIHLLLRRLSP